jgi:nitrogen fixation NifU-like protein
MAEMYTERLLDHYRTPRNRGRLDPGDLLSPTAQILSAEEYNPLCGDRVTIDLAVAEGRVTQVRFEGRGCALCLGAASILTEAIEGRHLDDLTGFGPDEFLAELASTPRPSRLKCALLPWMAFRHAAFGETEWPLDT